MHYANGRAARAGDLVRGSGYNIKDEIVGLLVFADPGASANNCRIATVTATSPVLHYAYPCPQPSTEPDSKGKVRLRKELLLRRRTGCLDNIGRAPRQVEAFVG